MQIKFLNIYNFYDIDDIQVQYELLDFWKQSIVKGQINFINKAEVEFKNYTFAEYPDQTRLNKELNYKTSYHIEGKQIWQVLGKCYESFDELYNELSKTHRLMELVITVEDFS